MSAIVPAKRASASALVPAKRVREVKLVPPRRSSSQVLADRRADPAIAADLARPLTRDTLVARLSPVARLNHNRLIRQWNESYELYLEQNDGKNPLGFPPKLKVGMSMPEENESALLVRIYAPYSLYTVEIICEFARYLTLVTEDHIDELARVNTLQHNVRTLFDVLHRLPYIVAQTTPLSVQSSIDSNCICGITTTTLATAARAKYYMSSDDAIIISRLIWENTDLFHTTRMRVQTHYKFLLQNLSLERSESMFQAARYKVSTNKKTDLAVAVAPPFLCWSDYKFQLVPNPQTPSLPYLVVQLRVRFHKYSRHNDSEVQDFAVDVNESYCALSSLLYMAFQDDIFKCVQSIEELLRPVNPPTTRITLQLREEARQLPILRAEYLEGEDWHISPTEPLGNIEYATILKTLSEDAGFPCAYCPPTSYTL